MTFVALAFVGCCSSLELVLLYVFSPFLLFLFLAFYTFHTLVVCFSSTGCCVLVHLKGQPKCIIVTKTRSFFTPFSIVMLLPHVFARPARETGVWPVCGCFGLVARSATGIFLGTGPVRRPERP